MSEPIISMRAVVYGDVQGVGFRAYAKKKAEILNLNGTVRNLENGAVEICAQGSKSTLDKFLSNLKASFSIERIEMNDTLPLRDIKGFAITG